MLSNQSHVLEHDLLSCKDARRLPPRERGVGAVDGRLEFCLSGLRHARDQVIGGGIMHIDPGRGRRGPELVVDEVGGIDGLLHFVAPGKVDRRRRGGRGARGRQKLGARMHATRTRGRGL